MSTRTRSTRAAHHPDLQDLGTHEEVARISDLVLELGGLHSRQIDQADLEEALAPVAYGVQQAFGKDHPLLNRIKEGASDTGSLLAIWRDVLALAEPDLAAVRHAVHAAREAWEDHEEDEG